MAVKHEPTKEELMESLLAFYSEVDPTKVGAVSFFVFYLFGSRSFTRYYISVRYIRKYLPLELIVFIYVFVTLM